MINQWEEAQNKEFDREVFGDQGLAQRAFLRPPGRPDLSYGDLNALDKLRRENFSLLRQAARKPKSRIKIPPNAWALNLRASKSKLNPFVRGLMDGSEFFLCRYILQLVEAQGEKIEWASVDFSQSDGLVYCMWPTETFKSKTEIKAAAKAEVGFSAKVGLTPSLDIVEIPVSGTLSVMWEARWRWVSAIVQAWGIADSQAGWRIDRDSDAPFAGDRELYMMLQLPRNKVPQRVTAEVKVELRPSGLMNAFLYSTEKTGPIEICYHVG